MLKRWCTTAMAVGLVAVVLGSCSPTDEAEDRQPQADRERRPFHVVLVSLDTLRADHMSLYGYERSTTPFMERLAEESVVFDRALSHSSHTAPAHRALFQSQNVSQLSPEVATLPQILSRQGFRTAAFVGGAKISAEFGFDAFFDEFKMHAGGFRTATRRLGEWLAQEHDRPFFLFVHTYDVHLPYDPPEPYDQVFFPEYEGRVTGPGSRQAVQDIGQAHLPVAERRDPVPADLDKLVALYDGGILYADSQIERLVENLKQTGHWDDTLFIVLSDHGEEFWEHRGMGHGFTLYQEVIHVPLLIHFPRGRFAGERVETAVGLIDVLPTILDVVGLPAEPGHQGTSLLRFLRGDDGEASPVLSQTEEMSSLVRYPWKLMVTTDGDRYLFNLDEDPQEQSNLAAEEAERLAALSAELEAILASSPQFEIESVNPEVEDEELRRQLEALGYLNQ